ncbi:hypothetical protein SDC9_204467 [bioreactor metagenome]|uniref:Uncharacterized protein n=1 Tax=bioreactor metagenome TaxID=1076179 RepID=A0A645IZA9_9ZZZZ
MAGNIFGHAGADGIVAFVAHVFHAVAAIIAGSAGFIIIGRHPVSYFQSFDIGKFKFFIGMMMLFGFIFVRHFYFPFVHHVFFIEIHDLSSSFLQLSEFAFFLCNTRFITG